MTPFTVNIEPDANMAGIIGAVVNSAKAGSNVQHFVTPKKSAELNQDYVVLKAVGVTADQITDGNINQIVQWEGGESIDPAHPLVEPLKRRVKRDATGTIPNEVKIKAKQGGAVAAQMNVWVVWSEAEAFPAENYDFLPSGNPPNDAWSYSSSFNFNKYWRFRFTIQPADIITADEKPNLKGNKITNPPGYKTYHHNVTDLHSDHAKFKWDVSRQLEVTVLNPNLIPKVKFPQVMEYANQPKKRDIPIPFPANPVKGNDDPGGPNWLDEDANPYNAYEDVLRVDLEHGIGQLSSSDRPEIKFLNTNGVQGATLGFVSNFKEFARLNLLAPGQGADDGKGWYRISDYSLWHYVMAATYGEEPSGSGTFRWVKTGSVSGKERFEIPEEP